MNMTPSAMTILNLIAMSLGRALRPKRLSNLSGPQ